MTRYLRDLRNAISDATGFDAGSRWETAEEVREYFTPDAQRAIWCDDAEQDPDTLSPFSWISREDDGQEVILAWGNCGSPGDNRGSQVLPSKGRG